MVCERATSTEGAIGAERAMLAERTRNAERRPTTTMTTCAHCRRAIETVTFHCPECGAAPICARCAAEVGLKGPDVMMAIVNKREQKADKAAREARWKQRAAATRGRR